MSTSHWQFLSQNLPLALVHNPNAEFAHTDKVTAWFAHKDIVRFDNLPNVIIGLGSLLVSTERQLGVLASYVESGQGQVWKEFHNAAASMEKIMELFFSQKVDEVSFKTPRDGIFNIKGEAVTHILRKVFLDYYASKDYWDDFGAEAEVLKGATPLSEELKLARERTTDKKGVTNIKYRTAAALNTFLSKYSTGSNLSIIGNFLRESTLMPEYNHYSYHGTVKSYIDRGQELT